MSMEQLWQDLYYDIDKQLRDTRKLLLDQLHAERLRVITLEGHRLTLLSKLQVAARALPCGSLLAADFQCTIDQLRAQYEPAKTQVLELPARQGATHQTPDHGSALGQAGVPVGTQDGVSQSTGGARVSTDVHG